MAFFASERLSFNFLSVTLFSVLLTGSLNSYGSLCQGWSQAESAGTLDAELLPEASGLAISRQFQNRLYHINDKGNAPVVHMTSFDGESLGSFEVEGVTPEDTEDLAVGPCGNQSCLFLGDIGDNKANRESISISWIQEKKSYRQSEQILGEAVLHYPKGAYNAEAMVIHPNGFLYLFTKGKGKKAKKEAGPSSVFRISLDDLMSGNQSQELQFVGSFDVPGMLEGEKPGNQLVTGATVDDSGRKLVLLTYQHMIEIDWDFESEIESASQMQHGRDYQVIELNYLAKQEAISFFPDSPQILVTSEAGKGNGEVEMLTLSCLGE